MTLSHSEHPSPSPWNPEQRFTMAALRAFLPGDIAAWGQGIADAQDTNFQFSPAVYVRNRKDLEIAPPHVMEDTVVPGISTAVTLSREYGPHDPTRLHDIADAKTAVQIIEDEVQNYSLRAHFVVPNLCDGTRLGRASRTYMTRTISVGTHGSTDVTGVRLPFVKNELIVSRDGQEAWEGLRAVNEAGLDSATDVRDVMARTALWYPFNAHNITELVQEYEPDSDRPCPLVRGLANAITTMQLLTEEKFFGVDR